VGGHWRDDSCAAGAHAAAGARLARDLQVRGLSDQEREAVTEELTQAFAPFSADEGYELPGVCLNAVAR
jgi:hypothetical protein